ncbi:hypothetical protein DSL64_12210 [Dyadobacter luteus]|uniref:Lipoprotein n=1 Tax=Dyadobacter luteus TaxID=2259619 RepID=A0A3D8YC17_9BACT|nr:hypothetical protein [Dyadobacter luteus]REA61215.1 hypothetical protein DSL64_12210 [Dyadobacter luteus]
MMIKKYSILLVGFLAIACGKENKTETDKGGMVIVNDTIPEIRTNIKKEAVASFSEPVPDKDKLNDWKFSVDAYETGKTFQYLLKIRYKELQVKDSLTLPDFGIMPTIELQKGSEDFSCIVGFKGKENEFKEYKKVFIDNGELRITTIKAYRRTLQRKK